MIKYKTNIASVRTSCKLTLKIHLADFSMLLLTTNFILLGKLSFNGRWIEKALNRLAARTIDSRQLVQLPANYLRGMSIQHNVK